jgi:WD40 repeat protein
MEPANLHRLSPGHTDLVHDIAYDFYGQRLVTCSSDHKIKVWDFPESPEERATWQLNDSWKVYMYSSVRHTFLCEYQLCRFMVYFGLWIWFNSCCRFNLFLSDGVGPRCFSSKGYLGTSRVWSSASVMFF